MNLLDEIKDKLVNQLSMHTADFLDEEQSMTSAGIKGSFATILAGMVEKGSTKKGANEIYKTIEKQDVEIVDHVDRIFTRSPQTINGLSNIGTRELPKYLGAHQREASNLIAEKSGINRNSTSKLMKVTTPFLMAILGKKVAEGKLDSEGLMNLITSEKANIKNNLPSGMTDVMELKSFGWTKKEVVEPVEEKKPKKVKVEKPKEVIVEEPITTYNDTDTSGSGLGWLKWLLPLLLIGGLIWFLLTRTGCAGATENVAATTPAVVEKVTEVVTNPLGAVNDAALSTLNTINFAAGSVGSQMMTFIKGGAEGEGRFRFNNLNFASGSAVIDGESGIEVDNLASILKAYTDVKVAIEGYTDSQGNADSNLNLSQQRADAVSNRLLNAGISSGRMSTTGFGAANPIGDNATPEGRAENRRIELVITK